MKDYERWTVEDIRSICNFSYTDEELVSLYSQYSEEEWSALWEDNVEGLFVEWLLRRKGNND